MPKLENVQIIATLALAPVSIVASVYLWSDVSIGAAFVAPIVSIALAPLTAMEFKNPRNIAWMMLAAHVASMLALAVAG